MPAVASAAKPPPPRRPPAKPPVETTGPDVFGGFSFLHSGEANLKGWEISSSFPFRGSLRLVVDLSGHYGSFAGADLSQTTILGGARLASHHGGRLRPFGEALAGVSRSKSTVDVLSSSSTGWGGAFGAGADYGLTGRWAVRGQAHLLLIHSAGVWDTDPRLSAGIAYRFRH